MNKALDYDHGNREYKIKIQASVSTIRFVRFVRSLFFRSRLHLAGREWRSAGQPSSAGQQAGYLQRACLAPPVTDSARRLITPEPAQRRRRLAALHCGELLIIAVIISSLNPSNRASTLTPPMTFTTLSVARARARNLGVIASSSSSSCSSSAASPGSRNSAALVGHDDDSQSER